MVRKDLEKSLKRLVREDISLYIYTAEGLDDMPALYTWYVNRCFLNTPVSRRRPVLGRWQGVLLFEHRSQPHRRQVALHLGGN